MDDRGSSGNVHELFIPLRQCRYCYRVESEGILDLKSKGEVLRI